MDIQAFIQNVIDEGPKVIAGAAALSVVIPAKWNTNGKIGKILQFASDFLNLLALNFGNAKNAKR